MSDFNNSKDRRMSDLPVKRNLSETPQVANLFTSDANTVMDISTATTMSLEEFALGVAPWFAFFHLLFWAFKLVLPVMSPTYNTQAGPEKSYWACSLVSNV